MRKRVRDYHVGDERIVRRFLLHPVTINEERRWLEFARIRQRCTIRFGADGDGNRVRTWENVAWVDREVA